MPLLSPDEITAAALMSDVAVRRNARNQMELQLTALLEGLELPLNPINRDAPKRQHTVAEGDTLQIVALRQLGDARYWVNIAQLNGLQYPFAIRPGMILQLPELADE